MIHSEWVPAVDLAVVSAQAEEECIQHLMILSLVGKGATAATIQELLRARGTILQVLEPRHKVAYEDLGLGAEVEEIPSVVSVVVISSELSFKCSLAKPLCQPTCREARKQLRDHDYDDVMTKTHS